ncbi:MAG: universal stress protein [Jatrophihabitans sp.]
MTDNSATTVLPVADTEQEPAGNPTGRIVVGVDGSASSIEALRWAARFATTNGAGIDAIFTWNYPTNVGYPMLDWNPAQDVEKALTAAVDEAYGSDRPADVRLLVKQGGAARVLLEESRQAQLLVVGSRGLGGFTGLLLGSVSSNCAEHAHCPVLVVHGTAGRPS